MTRPKPIKMNPERLPELTRAQSDRVKLFREHFKGIGKVSVTRKGQRRGTILIKVTGERVERFYQYDAAGRMITCWTQRPMFTLGETMTDKPSVATNPYTEG